MRLKRFYVNMKSSVDFHVLTNNLKKELLTSAQRSPAAGPAVATGARRGGVAASPLTQSAARRRVAQLPPGPAPAVAPVKT